MPEDGLDITGSAIGPGDAWQCPPAWPKIAGYTVVRRLACGDRAEVFLATERSRHRLVALKVLRRWAILDEGRLESCLRDAWTAAALGNAAVVPVCRVGEVEGRTYLVTAYMEGGSLADVLRRRRLEPEEAAGVGARIAGALAAAHRQGLVHEAVRPSNVLFDGRGNAFLADFGVARLRERYGLLAAHAEYVAPEVARGDASSGPAADLYALGVTLYEALTGRPPFRGEGPGDTLRQHCSAPVPPLPAPEPVASAVGKCLAKDPSSRFRDGAELVEALGHAEPTGQPIGVAEAWVAPPGSAVGSRGLRPWPLGLGAIVAVILGSLALAWHHGISTAPVAPAAPHWAASPPSGPAAASSLSATSSASVTGSPASDDSEAGARSSWEAPAAALAGSQPTPAASRTPPQPAGMETVRPADTGLPANPSSSDADGPSRSSDGRGGRPRPHVSPSEPPPTPTPPPPPPTPPRPTATPTSTPSPPARPSPSSAPGGQRDPGPRPRDQATAGPDPRSDAGSASAPGTHSQRPADAGSPGGRPSSRR